jgi:hypothetical protein
MTGRRIMTTVAALLGWAAGAPVALADASFDPNVDYGVSGTGDAPILPIALALVVGFALVLLARTRGAGAVLTLLATLSGLVLGGFFVAAGLFGDLSGRHEIFPVPIVIGVVIIAVVLFVLGGRRRRVSASLDR